MKQWLFNFVLLSCAIGIGIGLFFMKQRVVEYEKELNHLTNEILNDKREIRTLKADWAVLTEPSRLRRLLAHSKMGRIDVKQIVTMEDVALSPVPVPPKKPANTDTSTEEAP